MRDVVPQHRKQAVTFVPCAENALRDVSASTWFGSRVPKRPPLQAEIHRERDYGKGPHCLEGEGAGKIREESGGIGGSRSRCRAHRVELRKHGVHPANRVDRVPRNADDDGHFQDKLKEIGPQHPPEAA